MMVSTDRLLLFFTADDTSEGDDDIEIEHFTTLNDRRARLDAPTSSNEHSAAEDVREPHPPLLGTFKRLPTGILGAFVSLAVLQLGILVLTSRGLQSLNPDDPRLINVFTEETLPVSLGRWNRKAFNTESRSLTNYQGRNSAQWVYESDSGELVIGVDYPFLGWHELTGCYVAEGCELRDREIMESENTVRATIIAPSGGNGRLLFAEYMTNGQPLLPLGNDAGTLAYWRSRLQSALIRQFASFRRNLGSFQVQLLHQHLQPLSGSTEKELIEFHRLVSERIVEVVKEATQSNER
jgi:hypothetical protein